ncbi:MAG: hypothetical protein J2P41_10790 [Blastocatellia bacterium]|nr:hypothetical protein [Blastocatellia bacterium]
MEALQNQFESVAKLQNSLQNAGIQSAVIGGIAVAIWGNPRLTKDADLKVFLSRDQSLQLLNALPAEYKPISPNPEGDLRNLGFIFTQDANGVRIDLLLSEFEVALDDSTLVNTYQQLKEKYI